MSTTECLTHSQVREIQVWYNYGLTREQIFKFYPLCREQIINELKKFGKKGGLPMEPVPFDLATADLGTLVIPVLED